MVYERIPVDLVSIKTNSNFTKSHDINSHLFRMLCKYFGIFIISLLLHIELVCRYKVLTYLYELRPKLQPSLLTICVFDIIYYCSLLE